MSTRVYDRIAALVIEDTDIDIAEDASKRWSDSLDAISDLADLEARRQFSRRFDSFEELSDTLSRWYEPERIQGMRGSGHVFERQDGTWWSGISPLAHVRLCISTTPFRYLHCVLFSIAPFQLHAHTYTLL